MIYPLKFRQQVSQTKENFNLTLNQTSERFDVSIRTLFRWQIKIKPWMTRNKPATKLNMDALAQDGHLFPDDYQWERAKRLGVVQRTSSGWIKKARHSRAQTDR